MICFACNIVSTVFVYFYIPETRLLPLEEIGALFGDEVVVHLNANLTGLVEEDILDTVTFEDGKVVSKGEVKTVEDVEEKSDNHPPPSTSVV